MSSNHSGPSELAPINWLITGGCGFIGCNLVRSLLESPGNRVRILDNMTIGRADDLDEGTNWAIQESVDGNLPDLAESPFQIVVADCCDKEAIKGAMRGIQNVVHLAANTGVSSSVENPFLDCNTNVFGTLTVLEAARQAKCRRVIFSSSGAPLGECIPPINEDATPHPASPYGASKLAGEGYCSAYWKSFGLETVTLRFSNVYGPGSHRKDSVVAKVIRQALAGEALEIFGDGNHTRDFIYISDLVAAIECAAKKSNIGGEIFQIATSIETTVRQIIDLIREKLAQHGIADIEVMEGAVRVGDVRRNYSDTRKATEILKWTAMTPLSDGIEKTVRWTLLRE
jgi:UDP-glucose 4-epimerase